MSVFVLAPAANAAPGVTTTVLHNGSELQPDAEVRTGDTLKLRMQYTPEAVGQVVEITLGPGVTVGGNFPSNEAVESVVPNANGDGVIVTFKNPWPNIQEGIVDLDLVMTPVGSTQPGEVKWNDGTGEQSVPVVFVRDGDQHENVGDGFAKTVSPGNLDAYLLKDQDGNYLGLNTTAPNDIRERDLTYTLTINTPAGAIRPDGFTISDVLPAGLGYAPNPVVVTATETTWDANGYNPEQGSRNFVLDSSTATTFDGHIAGDLVGPSVLRLSYTVRVTDVAELDAALQSAYTARAGAPGNYEIFLKNTATFGGDSTAEANVRLRGTVAGPCPACVGDFGKGTDLTTEIRLAQADGTLLEPVDIDYTISADLGQWDGHSPNFTLNDNVVIQDRLLAQANWRTGSGFLTVTAAGGSPITDLTEAANCPATAADFAGDQFVGQYCVNGQDLFINVGKNSATDLTIVAKARLTTVDGLPTVGEVEGGERYRVRNTAVYRWGNQSWTTPAVDGFVVVPEANSEGE